jgi:hypothetical protein
LSAVRPSCRASFYLTTPPRDPPRHHEPPRGCRKQHNEALCMRREPIHRPHIQCRLRAKSARAKALPRTLLSVEVVCMESLLSSLSGYVILPSHLAKAANDRRSLVGQSAGNNLTLGYLTLYEPSPPGALIPRRNQPEMWSAGLSDLGKVFVEGFHTLGPRGSSLGECRGTDTIGGTSAYSFVGKGGRAPDVSARAAAQDWACCRILARRRRRAISHGMCIPFSSAQPTPAPLH